MGIKLLDCTLRDGGHINRSMFGQKVIDGIVHKMYSSKVDYLEVGFLRTDIDTDSLDMAVYSSIAQAEEQVPYYEGITELALMAQEDQFDINQLASCTSRSRFKMIRVSFHDFDFEAGMDFAKAVISKGYKCCINPINLPGYSDEKIIEIVKQVNDLHPFGFTIVDTFGSLQRGDLYRIYYLIENNLDKDISLGLHLHENLSLAYSLGQEFLRIKNPCRDVIIDGSLYGMGRVPGNLNIELMMDYLNINYNCDYNVSEALEAIDEFIISIKQKHPWGYSIAYSLSAKNKAHRTYAEYLLQKGKITIADINTIMQKIDNEKKTRYDVDYIENLYRNYMDVEVDDNASLMDLRDLYKDKDVCVVAPGKSIKNIDKCLELLKGIDFDFLLALNFVEPAIPFDSLIYTNQKRYSNDCLYVNGKDLIVSSNVRSFDDNKKSIIKYATLTNHRNLYSDSSLLMVLKLFSLVECRSILLVGFDGFKKSDNFYSEGYEREKNYLKDNKEISDILPVYLSEMNISFMTPSLYEKAIASKKN